jgi:hypothetical protein
LWPYLSDVFFKHELIRNMFLAWNSSLRPVGWGLNTHELFCLNLHDNDLFSIKFMYHVIVHEDSPISTFVLENEDHV